MTYSIPRKMKRQLKWRIVLDVLKPHSPSLPEFATRLRSVRGVKAVDVVLVEIDKQTESLKVTVSGKFKYADVVAIVEEMGAAVHSVDHVSIGKF